MERFHILYFILNQQYSGYKNCSCYIIIKKSVANLSK
jgi:hypothetical protein